MAVRRRARRTVTRSPFSSDGKAYQVTGDLAANKNEKLVPHMTHNVEITGDVTNEADGTMKIAGANLKMLSK